MDCICSAIVRTRGSANGNNSLKTVQDELLTRGFILDRFRPGVMSTFSVTIRSRNRAIIRACRRSEPDPPIQYDASFVAYRRCCSHTFSILTSSPSTVQNPLLLHVHSLPSTPPTKYPTTRYGIPEPSIPKTQIPPVFTLSLSSFIDSFIVTLVANIMLFTITLAPKTFIMKTLLIENEVCSHVPHSFDRD